VIGEYAPVLASLFSGLIIPGGIWVALRVKKALNDLQKQMVSHAQNVALTAAETAITVAESAKEAAAETEKRQAVLLEEILEQAKLTNGRVTTLENSDVSVAKEFGVIRERLGFVEGNLAGMNAAKGKEPI
jgi:hypothetical protein